MGTLIATICEEVGKAVKELRIDVGVTKDQRGNILVEFEAPHFRKGALGGDSSEVDNIIEVYSRRVTRDLILIRWIMGEYGLVQNNQSNPYKFGKEGKS
jgi:hypothetical protein